MIGVNNSENPQSCVIWITGVSGSGKTTLAQALKLWFRHTPVLLDGDDMRDSLKSMAIGYSYEERRKLAFTYARFCRMIATQGIPVVCSTISLFHDVQKWNRRELPGYFEIFLNVDENMVRERDYKGVYASENTSGANIVGRDLTAEFPQNADLILGENSESIDSMVEAIKSSRIGYLFS